jgi:uncharacterized protein
MRLESVNFPCGELILNGYCYYPDVIGIVPGVVLCHPHPQNGGSMSSSVIRMLGSELAERSIIAFMFNFRGVGKSQGSYSNGIGEQDDAEAAVRWLEAQSTVNKDRLGLAGYSFGGGIAAAVTAKNSLIKALALVSPYLESSKVNCLNQSNIQKYFVTGNDDELILPEDVEAIYKNSAEPKELEIISGIDHFWFGNEKLLARKVVDFLSGALK